MDCPTLKNQNPTFSSRIRQVWGSIGEHEETTILKVFPFNTQYIRDEAVLADGTLDLYAVYF